MRYRSIFISDIHLGTKFSKAEQLLEFIKNNEAENLYLVGDIIDGWAIKRKFVWPQTHSDVIQKILRQARKGTNVFFIVGNHDEFIRPFLPMVLGDRFKISNNEKYVSLNGNEYLVIHGDLFDSVSVSNKWIAILGDKGYSFLLHFNGILNFFRKRFGFYRYWSFSKFVKENVKKSISFITQFETVLANYAHENGYSGVICGHIHKAEIRKINNIEYLNCGDWVESCTAIVETMNGEWKILDHFSE
jgi:UDP-2,3-diacylglucosamine pyrophosphatase LpxH